MIESRGIAIFTACAMSLAAAFCSAQTPGPTFKVIAFYTGKHDQAHLSFVREANQWLPKAAARNHFSYTSTDDWNNLNPEFLSHYQVVLFLDTRPEVQAQRKAFQSYMEKGGAWMGFHFSAFALTPSAYPQNWEWYHDQFLGSGAYVSNTWRPTPALLRVEPPGHPATCNLPSTFKASANEWYRWSRNLRRNPDIQILLSIDPSSFPLGTGPKPQEIWTSGDFPVAWTHKKYRMIYLNMGHNEMDYEHGGRKELSFTFENEVQNRFILDGLLWLGGARETAPMAGTAAAAIGGRRADLHAEPHPNQEVVTKP